MAVKRVVVVARVTVAGVGVWKVVWAKLVEMRVVVAGVVVVRVVVAIVVLATEVAARMAEMRVVARAGGSTTLWIGWWLKWTRWSTRSGDWPQTLSSVYCLGQRSMSSLVYCVR